MENRKKRTALKILIFILLLAILYFAYSVGKYDIKRENMIESVQ
jgi:cbb3-type cytochrome oxidase subunit 3